MSGFIDIAMRPGLPHYKGLFTQPRPEAACDAFPMPVIQATGNCRKQPITLQR
jgi:hypothetical protein